MDRELTKVSYEHIFVDNNSLDTTVAKLRIIAERDSHVKVLVNSKNVGPYMNMWIGMEHSSGKAVIPLLPADLQDPVDVIPQMYSAWQNGYLIAYGVISKRDEKFFLRKVREFYYWMINQLAHEEIPRNSGEFLLADRRVVETVLETNDYYPYLRGMFAMTGVRSLAIPYRKVKRKKGKSKENIFTYLNHAINGFISTSRIIPRLSFIFGILIAVISILLAFLNLSIYFTKGNNSNTKGIPTIVIAMLFIGGVQLFFLGLIGEYVQAIYRQVRRIPKAFQLEKINF